MLSKERKERLLKVYNSRTVFEYLKTLDLNIFLSYGFRKNLVYYFGLEYCKTYEVETSSEEAVEIVTEIYDITMSDNSIIWLTPIIDAMNKKLHDGAFVINEDTVMVEDQLNLIGTSRFDEKVEVHDDLMDASKGVVN